MPVSAPDQHLMGARRNRGACPHPGMDFDGLGLRRITATIGTHWPALSGRDRVGEGQ